MRCRGFLIVVLALLAGAAPARPQVESAARQAFDAERRKLQTHFSGLPPLDAGRLDELLRLKTENGRLVAELPVMERVDYPQRQFRAKLAELGDGVTVVSLGKNHLSRGDAIQEIRNFSLTHYDLTNPDETRTLVIQCQPDFVRIQRVVRSVEGALQTVEIIEHTPQLNAAAGRFQMTQTQGREAMPPTGLPPTQPESRTIAEASFQDFIRRHPPESRGELRPLLRRLGQERVFAPDPLMAWQVFADRRRIDGPLVGEVEATLASLREPAFRSRDAAVDKLAQLGRPGAAVLLHVDRTTLTPEQNARIDEVLRPYSQLTHAEAVALRRDPDFLLDCLYADDEALRAAALSELRELTRQDLRFEPAGDAGARVENVRALRLAVESWARG